MSQTRFLLNTLETLSQRLDNTMSQLEASKLTVQSRKDEHELFWKQTQTQAQAQRSNKRGPAGGRTSRSVKRSRGGMTPDPVGRM